MEIMKEKSVAFTGHRPQKLKGSEKTLRQKLGVEIDKAIEKGYDTFISGMAEGVDLWAAELVLKRKEKNPDLKLVCAVPFKGVEKKRTDKQRTRFENVLAKADAVEYVCPKYERDCFYKRDYWIVDHAGMLIGVYNGTPGGTKITIEYARKNGIETILIEDAEPEYCTICGKELDLWDLQEKGLSFDDVMGYGSKYDCCHVRFRLCCSCFDKFIDSVKKHGKEDPVICTDVRFAGEMNNDQMKRLNQILKLLNQAGTDAVVDRIGKMNPEEIEAYLQGLEQGLGAQV